MRKEGIGEDGVEEEGMEEERMGEEGIWEEGPIPLRCSATSSSLKMPPRCYHIP